MKQNEVANETSRRLEADNARKQPVKSKISNSEWDLFLKSLWTQSLPAKHPSDTAAT
jgi:hypothetical protein